MTVPPSEEKEKVTAVPRRQNIENHGGAWAERKGRKRSEDERKEDLPPPSCPVVKGKEISAEKKAPAWRTNLSACGKAVELDAQKGKVG